MSVCLTFWRLTSGSLQLTPTLTPLTDTDTDIYED